MSELSIYPDFRAQPGKLPTAMDYDDGVHGWCRLRSACFAHV
jgi:hypothetical protein